MKICSRSGLLVVGSCQGSYYNDVTRQSEIFGSKDHCYSGSKMAATKECFFSCFGNDKILTVFRLLPFLFLQQSTGVATWAFQLVKQDMFVSSFS